MPSRRSQRYATVHLTIFVIVTREGTEPLPYDNYTTEKRKSILFIKISYFSMGKDNKIKPLSLQILTSKKERGCFFMRQSTDPRIVIALGGNALGNNPKEQEENIEKAVPALIDLISLYLLHQHCFENK